MKLLLFSKCEESLELFKTFPCEGFDASIPITVDCWFCIFKEDNVEKNLLYNYLSTFQTLPVSLLRERAFKKLYPYLYYKSVNQGEKIKKED